MAKSTGKSKGKSFSVILEAPQEKKKVTRYDAPEDADDPAMSNAYISNTVIKGLGNPDEVKITIEAA